MGRRRGTFLLLRRAAADGGRAAAAEPPPLRREGARRGRGRVWGWRTGIAACGPSDAAELEAELKRLADRRANVERRAADGADADAEAVEEAADPPMRPRRRGRRASSSDGGATSCARRALPSGSAASGCRTWCCAVRRLALLRPSQRSSQGGAPGPWEVLSQDESFVRAARWRTGCCNELKRGKRVPSTSARARAPTASAARPRAATSPAASASLSIAARAAFDLCRRPHRPPGDPRRRQAADDVVCGQARGAGRFGGLRRRALRAERGGGGSAAHEWRCAPPVSLLPLGLFKFPRTRHVLGRSGTRHPLVPEATS